MKRKVVLMVAAGLGLLLVLVVIAPVLLGLASSLSRVGAEVRAASGRPALPQTLPFPQGESGKQAERALEAPGASQVPAPGAPAGSDAASIIDRMIIYTATLTLQVRDVPGSIDAVAALAERAGGFVAGTSVRHEGERMLATLTLRVPARTYNQVMGDLRRLALKVVDEQSGSQDVGEEYADLESQLRNLEATEAQYLALMKQARTIEEILRVQQRLSEVRGQIERSKGRMKYLERQSDMAGITVHLAAPPVKDGKIGWDPLAEAEKSWQASLVVLQALATAVIRVAVFFWWLVPPVLLGSFFWGMWWLTRRVATT